MKALRAGSYRQYITVQKTTQTQNATYGAVTDAWSTHVNAWASVEPLQTGSRKFFEAAKFNAEVTHLIKLRWQDGITPKMRVSWDSRLFGIEVVLNTEERDREAWLLCKEVV